MDFDNSTDTITPDNSTTLTVSGNLTVTGTISSAGGGGGSGSTVTSVLVDGGTPSTPTSGVFTVDFGAVA